MAERVGTTKLPPPEPAAAPAEPRSSVPAAPAAPDPEITRRLRLFPWERLLWHGAPVRGVPRDYAWVLPPLIAGVVAAVSALFAGLLAVAAVPGWEQSAMVALWAGVFAVGATLAPHYVLDGAELAVTDKRVLCRRGGTVRSIDRKGITFGRVRWNRSAHGIGHLELVRSVPFGPLARSQRLVLYDVRAPDALFALIRGAADDEPGARAEDTSPGSEADASGASARAAGRGVPGRMGDSDLGLAERLDAGERVLWGGAPAGRMVGWREVSIAAVGSVVLALGIRYGLISAGILGDLEEVGLPLGSPIWLLLFLATLLTFGLLVAIGLGLVWYATVRALAEGRATEYLVTDRRVLIRRGRTELSVDRVRIVDVAERAGPKGLRHAFLILDGPDGRALADGGALGTLLPSREGVPPILWELEDTTLLREILLGRPSQPSELRDAA